MESGEIYQPAEHGQCGKSSVTSYNTYIQSSVSASAMVQSDKLCAVVVVVIVELVASLLHHQTACRAKKLELISDPQLGAIDLGGALVFI